MRLSVMSTTTKYHSRTSLRCLLRARHERERPRTRERALLALQQLVDATRAPWPAPESRLRCGTCHSRWAACFFSLSFQIKTAKRLR